MVFSKESKAIPTKKLSKRERRSYKSKTLKSYKKDRLYGSLIVFFGVTLLIVFLVWFYARTEQQEKTLVKTVTKEKIDRYDYLISSGDQWLEKKKYFNAIFQYRLALEVFPQDSLATFRLITASELNCEIYNNNCGESEKLLEQYKNQ